MAKNYRTRDGDMLDEICVLHYGLANLSQSVAATLEANPGLAARGAVYSSGIVIVLPDWKATTTTVPEETELWT